MSHEDTGQTKLHFGGFFTAIVIAQFLLLNMLAPGDGGRWARYAIISLALFDIVVYLAFYSGPRYRSGADPGLSIVGAATIVAASVVCVIAATFLMDAFKLP